MGMGPTAAAYSFPVRGSLSGLFVVEFLEVELIRHIASFLVEPSVCLKMAAGGFALPLQKYDLKGVQTWH